MYLNRREWLQMDSTKNISLFRCVDSTLSNVVIQRFSFFFVSGWKNKFDATNANEMIFSEIKKQHQQLKTQAKATKKLCKIRWTGQPIVETSTVSTLISCSRQIYSFIDRFCCCSFPLNVPSTRMSFYYCCCHYNVCFVPELLVGVVACVFYFILLFECNARAKIERITSKSPERE